MIYMWFTGINYYKLAVEKDRDSIFTTLRPYRETRLPAVCPAAGRLLSLAVQTNNSQN
jgi:hypothetical protein